MKSRDVLEPDSIDGFEEAFNAIVQPLVNETRKAAEDTVASRGGTLVEEMLRSSQFNRVIVKVEEAAKRAVTEEVTRNALALGGLSLACGVVGGVFFKGRTGLAVAGGLAVVSLYFLTRAQSAPQR